MPRVGGEPHAIIPIGEPPNARDESGNAGSKSLVAELYDGCQLFEGTVSLFQRRTLDLIQPFAHALRRVLRRSPRQPESLEVDDATHAIRPKAGIKICDVASHAVADDACRRAGRYFIHQRIEVAEIIRKTISLLRPLAAPESAPVGRNDGPFLLEGIDDKLKCLSRIQPAMQ